MQRAFPVSDRGLRTLVPLLVAGLLQLACGSSQADLKQQREQGDYHYHLAYGYYFDKQSPNGDAALQEVLASIDLDPANPDARLLAGLIFMGRQQYTDAVVQFRTATELRPKFHYALNNLGACYLAMERWDDAIGIYRQLAADITYPTPGVVWNNLGWALYKKGDRDEARQDYLRAINLSAQLCPPYNNLAMLLVDEGAYDQAEKYLDLGVKRCPTYAELYYHLGRVEAQRARVDQARERFQRCVELSGETPLAERCESHLAALTPPENAP
jgi:Tfp pilus assembly protein PilF